MQQQALLRAERGQAAGNAALLGRQRASCRRQAQRQPRALGVHAAAAPAPQRPLVKVCGVTTPEEALHAARSGANFIGLILWPKSKRSVIDLARAAQIAAAAREGGAEPVGVFVDESAEQIAAACDAATITYAQLHGDGARAALAKLPMKYRAIWVVNADASGKLVTPLPGDESETSKADPLAGPQGWKKAVDWMSRGRRVIDFLLVDGVNAGSGVAFDWSQLRVPKGCSRAGWILAGGLNPGNVGAAIAAARPDGVDVASGVAGAGGVTKDPALVEAFIREARATAAAAPRK